MVDGSESKVWKLYESIMCVYFDMEEIINDAARTNRNCEKSHLNQGQQEHIRPVRPNHRIDAAAKNKQHDRRKHPTVCAVTYFFAALPVDIVVFGKRVR